MYLDFPNLIEEIFKPLFNLDSQKTQWKFVNLDIEQGICISLEKNNSVILIEFEDIDLNKPCYAQTSKFNVYARKLYNYDEKLNKEERTLVDIVIGLVAKRENEIITAERFVTPRKVQIREIKVKRALVPEGWGHYYFNPYVGCSIGCSFCYVQKKSDLSRRLLGLPEIEWGRYVDIKINAPEIIMEEISLLAPGPVRMSPIITDPYQPFEKKYRITRKSLEALLGSDFTPVILTRARRILEDLSLIKKFKNAIVGFSIPSNDDRYRKMFEPGADTIKDRIFALKEFSQNNVKTMLVIQPILPLDAKKLAKEVAPYTSFLRIDKMHFPEVVNDIYDNNKIGYAKESSFFEEKKQELIHEFGKYDVQMDELDNLAQLVTK